MHARQFYKKLYDGLYEDILALESSCIGLKMEGVMQQFVAEETDQAIELMSMLRNLGSLQLSEGVLLHDMSGVGLYTLAYVIAKAWADEKILQSYDAVIVVPLEWMHLKDNVLNIWDEKDAKIKAVAREKTLIILSGCTGPDLRINGKDVSTKTLSSWLDKIDALGCDRLIISNAAELSYLKCKPRHIKKITLQPLNLTVQYQCQDKKARVTIPGKACLETASIAIKRNFSHSDPLAPHVEYTPNWASQHLACMTGSTNQIKREIIRPEHIYPALGPQKTIKLILNQITRQPVAAANDDGVVSFSTPASWYSAAVTAQSESENKMMACYRMGNYLIVRKLGNNYLACINLAENTTAKMPVKFNPDDDAVRLTQLTEAIRTLMAEPDFDTMQTDKLIERLDRIASAQRKQALGKLNKSSENALKEVKDHLRKDDPTKKRFNPLFARGQHDLAYHAIQQQVNLELAAVDHPTAMIRELLSGSLNDIPKNTAMGLAATLLSETCRYPLSFISTLCLLDLIEISNIEPAMWQTFFAHREHVNHGAPQTLKDAIIGDIVHTLGGLQPMSQGNSYHQVKMEAEKPKHGMHWVDFKSHLIIGCWLGHMIRKEKELNPHLFAALSRDLQEPIIDDMLLGFRNMGHVNPHIYDRLSRRLDTFALMLIEKKPLRELLSGNCEQTVSFLQQFNYTPFMKVLLPEFNGLNMTQYGKLLNTMACRFYLGTVMVEGGGGKIITVSTKAGQVVKTETPLHRYRLGLMQTILDIDPLFYAVHYHLALIHFNHENDPIEAYAHLKRYFKSAKVSDGDLYFTAWHLLLKCQLSLGKIDDFFQAAEYYFANYHDTEDEDYWLTHLLRATVCHERGKGTDQTIKKDLELFLSNVAYKDCEKYHTAVDILLQISPELYRNNHGSPQAFKTMLKEVADKFEAGNLKLYIHKNGFFSPSRYGTQKRPHGLFRDVFCYEGHPAVMLTSELSKQVALIKK